MSFNSRFSSFSVSTHSRAKAAAIRTAQTVIAFEVSTHSRAKAAASYVSKDKKDEGFNTQPREGGCLLSATRILPTPVFQHTAAQRRLLSKNETKTL